MSMYDAINNIPFILLAKSCGSDEATYEEYLHVIGKMYKKDIDSKYFVRKKRMEHLNNDYFHKTYKNKIIMFIRGALNSVLDII